MARLLFLSPIALALASPVSAAPDFATCMQNWKSLDADANGVLDRKEDKGDLLERAKKTDELTRDEYISLCTGTVVNESGVQRNIDGGLTQTSPNLPPDRGKGDLTRGTSKLSEQDVRKRLESQGFRSLSGLTLGEDGIWRGTAETSPGLRTHVAVDAQGDIVAKDQPTTDDTQENVRP